MDKIETLIELYANKGDAGYGREPVSQIEHALQCAMLAEQEGAAPALVAAALLHDVGHLLAKRGGEEQDDKHEDIGWGYLKAQFGDDVAEPVRLHVAAKRYLCATEPDYFGLLSAESVHSLELQGGRFSGPEAAEFRLRPYAGDAMRLRRWDDRAKAPGTATKAIRDYLGLLRQLGA
jgi:[1-hydroxy-2-(trimethylamino)ethyl]phosphonate dioxygenase